MRLHLHSTRKESTELHEPKMHMRYQAGESMREEQAENGLDVSHPAEPEAARQKCNEVVWHLGRWEFEGRLHVAELALSSGGRIETGSEPTSRAFEASESI